MVSQAKFQERYESYSGRVRVFGNFEDVSHVFNIETRDPILADLLLAGLRAQGLK